MTVGPNPSGLCMCGCGEPAPIAVQNHARYGWVKGQPLMYIRGHNNRKSPVEYLIEDRGHDTPCWIWQRAKNQWGYGHVNVNGDFKMAHRVAYERAHGPIPQGLHLDHLCRQPSCVNPDHLEPVTNAENTRRGAKAKLSKEIVAAIRESDDPPTVLARQYGVSYDTIWAAKAGRSWS